MNRFRHSRSRRFTALVALATFVLGTNYCVVAALAAPTWSEAPACHAMAKPAAPSHACCGHAPRGNAPSSGSVAKPCCMSASPVSSPEIAKLESLASVVATTLAMDAAASSATESSRPGRVGSEHPPHPAAAPAADPRSPRAPPRC